MRRRRAELSARGLRWSGALRGGAVPSARGRGALCRGAAPRPHARGPSEPGIPAGRSAGSSQVGCGPMRWRPLAALALVLATSLACAKSPPPAAADAKAGREPDCMNLPAVRLYLEDVRKAVI